MDKKYKINSLYGISVLRPEYVGKIVLVKPPFWKSLWYSLTSGLYEFFLLFMMALAFTVFTNPKAAVALIYWLIGA